MIDSGCPGCNLERRTFLRLAGAAVTGGLAATLAASARHVTTAGLGPERVAEHLTRPDDAVGRPPVIARMASVAEPVGAGPRLGSKRATEVVAGLYRLEGIRGVNAYLWLTRPESSGRRRDNPVRLWLAVVGPRPGGQPRWRWDAGRRILRPSPLPTATSITRDNWRRWQPRGARRSSRTSSRRRACPAADGATFRAPARRSIRRSWQQAPSIGSGRRTP